MVPGAGGSDPPPPTSSTSLSRCMHQSGSLPPNGSVSWCYTTSTRISLSTSGSGTLCIDRTGHRTESYSTTQLKNHLDSITVLDDGRLRFPEVSFFFENAAIDNCTVFADDGQICGELESRVNITLLRRSKPR
jgi:hypothetical protein